MDEMKETAKQTPEEEGYKPRPVWQVWAARVALVLVILVVVYQFLSIATGGM